MKNAILLFVCSGLLCLSTLTAFSANVPLQSAATPSQVVKKFYEQMRAKNYVEGFRLSVYRAAIETLSAEEMRDLAPDFERIAAEMPVTVEAQGEQVSGNQATVFIKLPGEPKPQEVTLIRVDGEWRVGDAETNEAVKRQGRAFFFNERMQVHEAEASEWMMEVLGAEMIYFKAKQRYASLEELVKLRGISEQLTSGLASGYRFDFKLGADGQGFQLTAVPEAYGRTGKLSFYADQESPVRAEDRNGQAATAASPSYRIKK